MKVKLSHEQVGDFYITPAEFEAHLKKNGPLPEAWVKTEVEDEDVPEDARGL